MRTSAPPPVLRTKQDLYRQIRGLQDLRARMNALEQRRIEMKASIDERITQELQPLQQQSSSVAAMIASFLKRTWDRHISHPRQRSFRLPGIMIARRLTNPVTIIGDEAALREYLLADPQRKEEFTTTVIQLNTAQLAKRKDLVRTFPGNVTFQRHEITVIKFENDHDSLTIDRQPAP